MAKDFGSPGKMAKDFGSLANGQGFWLFGKMAKDFGSPGKMAKDLALLAKRPRIWSHKSQSRQCSHTEAPVAPRSRQKPPSQPRWRPWAALVPTVASVAHQKAIPSPWGYSVPGRPVKYQCHTSETLEAENPSNGLTGPQES
ncbi:hypothetical protein THAOC_16569 [Thalassiosira oceanica]|uniref:Uncharacterized protein n=1 Tax=Thalassiosira oceanica TaxID=159749 RepID=K0SX57_THAOC|nr:hypothetical protein THAOC_16569 [Thalassiosira oceanica]|eukprot:EJK62802.1 hypothetical protein THAOC_16569 [Thalassiosira oceanica]